MQNNQTTQRIAMLNDLCCVAPGPSRQWLITPGIAELPASEHAEVVEKVASYKDFTEDNNPYGERDFCSFDHNGQKIFWKIDYYAPDMERGSEDPADPRKTVRVFTVMLADEY